MQALIVNTLGRPSSMAIEERPKPAVKDGYTLVRMHAATVNQLSNQVRCGDVPAASAPLVLSNDGSGTVEESARFAAGTRVAVFGGGELGITEDGLQQQWVLVEDKRIIELRDSLSLDEAAGLPVNYITAFQALKRVAKVAPGNIVLISGASGALGHALIQMTRAMEAIPVAVVSVTAKVERARQSGAKHVIDLSQDNLQQAVASLTDGAGADLAMDAVGGAVLGQLLLAVRTRGAVVSIGFAGGTQASIDVVDTVVYEKRVLGYDAHLETDTDVACAIAHIQRFIDRGFLRPWIDSVYALEQYEAAYQHLLSRKSLGTILLRL